MCGIAGFSRLNERTRYMAGLLAWEIDSRGRDSFGLTDGFEVVRKLGRVFDSWNGGKVIPEHWTRLILHTRAASNKETVTAELTHPYEFVKENGVKLIGVHNGFISNYKELDEKYPERKCPVDSMHIFQHLAEEKDTSEISGWGAVVWTDRMPGEGDRNLINLTRFNMTDLYIMRLESGEIVFCSKEDPIELAARMAGTKVEKKYNIGYQDHLYISEHREDPTKDELYVLDKKIKFGYRTATVSGATYYPAGGGSGREGTFHRDEPWGNYHHEGLWGGRSYNHRSTNQTYSSGKGGKDTSKTDATVLLDRTVKKKIALDKIGVFARDNNVCAKCRKNTTKRKETLLCAECMILLTTKELPKCKELREKANQKRLFDHVKVN